MTNTQNPADVWDECDRAWQAYLSGESENVPPTNPYRTEEPK